MERDHVNFIVGGCFFCLFVEDIEKYPESYFNAVIKKEWNPELEVPIKIDRDGRMFRYIAEFHHHGELPVTKKRVDVDVVQQIQVEADFYNLPLLVKACEKYVVSRISDRFDKEHFVTCDYCSDNKDNLINVVGALWAPVCSKGEISFNNDRSIMKSSTLLSLNVEELCAAAVQTSFCGVLEICADQLKPEIWKHFVNSYSLISFSPRMKLELRPCKLLICQQGSCVAEHRDSVRGENHIGKLVQIMNSEFTGGELIVRQNDTEMSINEPGQWIAMYGDALHRIEPVISGTRVALIFDLINVGPIDEDMFFSDGDRKVKVGCEREVSEFTRAMVYAALDEAINHYDEVIVCLQQVYLLVQADADCLRGGDSVLYKLLALQESKYSLSIVPLRLRYFTDQNDSSNCDLEGEDIDLVNAMASDCNRFCREQTMKKKQKSILLAVPITPSSDSQHCLGYFEEPGPDGLEIATWLATGLRISKRTEVGSETQIDQEADETARVGLKRDVPNENVDAPSKKFTLG